MESSKLYCHLMALIGKDATRLLFSEYAGCRVYIPIYPKSHHSLVRLLGSAVVSELSKAFGGTAINFPTLKRTKVKSQEIIKYASLGFSRREVAKIVGCSERWVFMVFSHGF